MGHFLSYCGMLLAEPLENYSNYTFGTEVAMNNISRWCFSAEEFSSRTNAYKTIIWTWMNRWRAQAMHKKYLRDITGYALSRPIKEGLVLLLLTLFMSSSAALAQSSSWKVGRGVISGEEAGSGLSLKISLRNAGAPSSDPVRVMARWTRSGPGKTAISGGELKSFVELGLFTREVKMKQTAILDMWLGPLGTRPDGIMALEVAIITGKKITDGLVLLIDR